MTVRFFSLLLFAWLLFAPMAAFSQDAKQIITKSLTAVDNAKTLKYRMKFKERLVQNGWNNAEVSTKVNVKPKQIYIKTIAPDKDIELLYNEAKYSTNVYVKPNGFPYMNVKLNPLGSHVMKQQHHPPTESGFGKYRKLMQAAVDRAGENFSKVFALTGSTTFDGKACYILTVNDPTFAFTNYTVKSGESLYDIARARLVAEYMILENNVGIDDFYDVKAGQVLKVPTSYAKKTTLYIDKQTYMPVYQKMEDNKGLFEEYAFYSLQVNPKFAANEFEETFEGYGF